ncbi:beta-ketoacyl synthase N-terminal-like domain-containing protein [Roseivivax lentus]|uniref:beta-ketoacyl synthase N-terminal-like domain-containing protein n=1 Tax=Roseivivax lentus TaxID=633194 RepID=UPI0013564E19|nr:beta-ketoacyl synthase N-terminal-like domain-containing protein [Roseivivax lentus]
MAAVPGLARDLSLVPKDAGVVGPAGRLLRRVLVSLDAATRHEIPVHLATNHSETDVIEAVYRAAADPAHPSIGREAPALLAEPIMDVVQHLPGLWPAETSYAACASGLYAAFLALLETAPGPRIVAAADALAQMGIAGFRRAGAIGADGCRPFSDDRDGLLIGEGAVAIRLDTEGENGLPRILGLGVACDAGHPTAPDAEGRGLEAAIRDALARADVTAEDVGGLVLHGTGTVANDATEAKVCARIWPKGAPPATSIKGHVGHCMGAAGLLNLAVAAEAWRRRSLPPTWPANVPGDVAGLDVVRGQARTLPRHHPVLATALGFGGANAAVLVGGRR